MASRCVVGGVIAIETTVTDAACGIGNNAASASRVRRLPTVMTADGIKTGPPRYRIGLSPNRQQTVHSIKNRIKHPTIVQDCLDKVKLLDTITITHQTVFVMHRSVAQFVMGRAWRCTKMCLQYSQMVVRHHCYPHYQ